MTTPPPEDIPTPRTDAEAFTWSATQRYVVSANLARTLERENMRLREELAELKSYTWCAYCGAEFRLENPNSCDLLNAHIARCEKHPMRRLEKELAEVKASQIITEEACVKALNQRDLLQSKLATAREALQRVWDEDECGWVIDETGCKECVKCGAKIHLNEAHQEDCTQEYLDRALASITDAKPGDIWGAYTLISWERMAGGG